MMSGRESDDGENWVISSFDLLRHYVLETPPKESAHDENDILPHMVAIEEEIDHKKKLHDPTLKVIPRFFFRKANDESDANKLLLKQLAQQQFIQKRAALMLNSDELDRIWEMLLQNATPPVVEGEERINYEGFTVVSEKLSGSSSLSDAALDDSKGDIMSTGIATERLMEYFRAELFLRFHRDDRGRISIPAFFNYILRKVALINNLVTLRKYDGDCDGYLTEKELENFVLDQIEKYPSLQSLQKQFYPTYARIAVRKFLFLSDRHGLGRVAINDILGSAVLVEFNELVNDAMTEEEAMSNWFSATSALSVYETFVRLDKDRDSLLSTAEFSQFNHGTLTPMFIDRLFQEYSLQQESMDQKMFVNFLLAYENRNTPQSISYFWNILDIKKQGYITPFTINAFFREIQAKLAANDIDPVSIEDLVVEVYAMVKPWKHPQEITLEELVACKCGGTVINMLIDVNGFYSYDTRESG